jgi:hypothetical protein
MEDQQPLSVERARTFIGGRHGSPTVTIALPFSNITSHDTEVRDAVAGLALLVARLARAAEAASDVDVTELGEIRAAAEALSAELGHA